jgi:CRP-like cAMP-binding protein
VFLKDIQKKSHLLDYQNIPQHTFFINKGLVRFCVLNPKGELHTTHFSMENEFTGDYASFLTGKPSIYTIEALEDIEVVLIPKTAIFWGYEHMRFGDRLGRLIAEHYFVLLDDIFLLNGSQISCLLQELLVSLRTVMGPYLLR